MGFYGNITNTAKTTFSFDIVYDTRLKMDDEADRDGVFLGRYVLIDYDEEPIKAYYDKNTDAFYSTANFSISSKLTPRENTVYQDLHNVYDKTGFYKYNKDTGSYYEISSNSPYAERFATDVSRYGRGYDSTVWVKRYNVETGTYKYAMIAELNAVVPTLHMVVDKPTTVPVTPYFDRDTTNIDYYLHMQSDYGAQVKQGNENYSDESIIRTPVYWAPDDRGYPSIVWGQPEEIDADIYYNKAGFEHDIRTYIEENADNEYTQNTINYSMAQSGRLYGTDADQGVYESGTPADDIYEWYFRLPALGNTVCSMWDKMYGYRNDNKRYLNKALHRNDTEDNLITYNKNTLIGMINTTQDLLGYHFVPFNAEHYYADETNYSEIVNSNPEIEITLNYDNNIEAQTIKYPVLNCLFYNDTEQVSNVRIYYHYAYAPKYEVVPNPIDPESTETYYYKDENDIFHIANKANQDAKNANGESIEPLYNTYYTQVPRWIMQPLVVEDHDTIYGILNQIHKLLGTNASDVRSFESMQGTINIIKDIISRIDLNLEPGRLLHTTNEGVIETVSDTYFPSASWDSDELLSGEGAWVSRYASVKVRENSENANRKIPKVVEFEDTDAASASAPVKLKNLQAELVSDNQRYNEGTVLKNYKKHDPNTLVLATRDKWIKLHPDAADDSIEFEHTQSPLVTQLSFEGLNTPGTDVKIQAPANEVNSTVNTENFVAINEGTAVVIKPSIESDNEVNDLTYDEDLADKNDNRLTIPTITVDNAGHIIAAGTKNYNIPHSFKKVQTTTIADTIEDASIDQEGISIAENLSDTLELAPQNRWIDISTTANNNTEGSAADKITFGHRLVPTLNTSVTLNGTRRTKDTEIPTVYRYGLPADKDIATLDEKNGTNEAANTFNIPYIEVDKAGHIVAAETHTVEIPDNYTTIKVGAASTSVGTGTTTGTEGATSDSLAGAATLTAETLTESIAFNPSNKWIRLKGTNTKGSDVITIGHEVHNIIATTSSEDLDLVTDTTNDTRTQRATFETQTIRWDNAGHITGHDTKTWTLPDAFHNIVVGGESTAVINATAGDGTLIADITFDSFSIAPSNKWIRLYGNPVNDSIVVGHLVQDIPTTAPTTDLNTSGTFKTEEYTYDEAGHIRSKATRTLTLPYNYKTFTVAQSTGIAAITTNTSSIVAQNQVDTMKFAAGNKWIQLAASDSSTSGNDTITIAHSLQGTAGSYTGTDLAFTEFGGAVTIYGYETDNAGHIISNPTYTLTLPKGSYSNSASNKLANVITGMSFNDVTGAITTTSENVGTLVLTGYVKLDTTATAAITATQTINEAFAALDNRIETEEEARKTTITNLRMFKTISVAGTALEADSNADTLSITAGNNGIVLTPTASSDSFTIGHKTGHEVTSGFYKFSTDAYGHVSATTAVTLTDLTTLGAATAENLTAHINNKENPHGVEAKDVGLGNVTNESKATMFTNAALTGSPTATTPTAGNNSTRIATTAFVNTAITNSLNGQWISSYTSFDALYNAIVEKLVTDGYIEAKEETPTV